MGLVFMEGIAEQFTELYQCQHCGLTDWLRNRIAPQCLLCMGAVCLRCRDKLVLKFPCPNYEEVQ